MSAPITVNCPNCRNPLKLPAELAGKIIRCKKCEGMFEVPGPAGARPAARPPAAKPVARPTAPPPAAPAPPPADEPIGFKDDLDDDNPNPYAVLPDDLDIPRCPFCAKELDPPDTKVCLNCGYDLLQRRRHESIQTVAHSPMDWIKHLGPGVACVLAAIALIAIDIVCFLNMRSWLTGSFLDADAKHEITGDAQFYVQPYCFNIWIGVFSAFLGWLCLKFAFKRLVLNWRPEEVLVRKRDE